MKQLLLFVCVLCVTGYGETLPWAATQKLEDITGLKLPADWQDQARWTRSFAVADTELPEYWDWRFYANGLPPVKRQRGNDCWAQGTVGVLESLVKIHTGKEVDLSVQQVIACSGYGSAASGGFFAHAYHKSIGAVATADFPYLGYDTRCKTGLKPEYELSDWGYIGNRGARPTTLQMKQAIMQHGPIGVTIAANGSLQNFTGDGVFKGCSSGMTNHIEVVVGWDDTEAGGVWFVRNSWGTTHGKDGYAKIPYGCSRVGDNATWADLKQ